MSTGALTQDTWYRIVFTNGACSVNSAAVKVTVSSASNAGELTPASSTVCTGSGTSLSLGTSTGIVSWYKSTNYVNATGAAATWTLVPLSTTVTNTALATGNLTYAAATPTTWYKAVATSGACTSTSNVVSVTVSPAAVAKAISGNTGVTTLATAICTTDTKALALATGYAGSIQWQYYNAGASATAVTNTSLVTWTDIQNATSATYNAVSSTEGNVWFRVKFTSSPCLLNAFSTPVNVWFKNCPPSITKIETEAPMVKTPFSVKAYPNPYTETFNLSLSTSSEDKVSVVVYDMTGRLIERRDVRPSDMVEQQIGDRYPSGVYNVVVTQGEEVKTVRVIKR